MKVIAPIKRMTWIHWHKQIEEDAIAWAKVNGKHSVEVLDAFRAGLREGARQAFATLLLHEHLEVID